MSVIALFATSNTVLIMLIAASRMLYGMSSNHALPKALCRIHPTRGTPYISVALIMALSLGSLFLGNIKTVALLTDLGVFITYLFVNASLVALRYTQPNHIRPFKSPVNAGRLPVLAALGALSCALMLLHFELKYVLFEFVVLAFGFVVYYTLRGREGAR
jgi:APA family basic amino acid/polyamine antiporter